MGKKLGGSEDMRGNESDGRMTDIWWMLLLGAFIIMLYGGCSSCGASDEDEGAQGEGRHKGEEASLEWYDKAMEGDAEAQYYMGESYTTGEDVEKDHRKAIEWYRRAAEQGHPEAQYKLGAAYMLGLVVREDCEKASIWFRKAAEQGQAEAQYSLGFLYEFGNGVTMDMEEAEEWYRKAAEQGNPEAIARLKELEMR